MNESIHKFFKIGTLLWMSYPGQAPLEALKHIVCDDYFDTIEISHIDGHAALEHAGQMLRQSMMHICYGAHPTILGQKLNPNALDEETRLIAEKKLLESVDEADRLGAKGIAFLAGTWEPGHVEEAYGQLLKTTRTVCSYAAKKGMFVELEVFDYDVDKAVLIGPAPLAARFADDVRTTHPNFGLLVDLSHIPLTHETPAFVIRTLKPFITHFHIGNAVITEGCPAYGDNHPRFGFPNSANNVDTLIGFLNVLKEEGFFRAESPYVLSFEIKPYGEEDPDIVLANAKRTLNRAWAMV